MSVLFVISYSITANGIRTIIVPCYYSRIKSVVGFRYSELNAMVGRKVVYEALQEIRVKHRWETINEETNAIDNARWEKTEYIP